MVRGISSVLGPILGGICVGLWGYAFVFIFNALSYLISGIFEMFIRCPSHMESGNQKSNFRHQFKEGMRFISSRVTLMILLLIIALLHFSIGSIEVFLPILAKEMIGSGPENLGYLQTSLGIGIIITSAFMSWINFQKNELKTLFLAIFGIGLIYILIAGHFKWYSQYLLTIFLLFALFGGIIILAATCFRSIVQKSKSLSFDYC